MGKNLRFGVVLLALLMWPMLLSAQSITEQVDALDKQASLTSYQKCVDILQKAVAADQNNYELNWRLARAHQNYGDMAASRKIPDWKKICVEHGRAGIKAGERAIQLNPGRVEGHFFAGCAVGTLSSGASVYTIIREGIADQIQVHLEKAYQIDKFFMDGGPIQALATFYKDVPRFLGGDLHKAEAYGRESMRYYPLDPAGRTILAEILIKEDKKKNREEIQRLLQGVASTPPDSSHYLEVWVTKAKALLAGL